MSGPRGVVGNGSQKSLKVQVAELKKALAEKDVIVESLKKAAGPLTGLEQMEIMSQTPADFKFGDKTYKMYPQSPCVQTAITKKFFEFAAVHDSFGDLADILKDGPEAIQKFMAERTGSFSERMLELIQLLFEVEEPDLEKPKLPMDVIQKKGKTVLFLQCLEQFHKFNPYGRLVKNVLMLQPIARM